MGKLVDILIEKNSAHMDDGAEDNMKLSAKQKKALYRELDDFDADNFEKKKDDFAYQQGTDKPLDKMDTQAQHITVFFSGVKGFSVHARAKVETIIADGSVGEDYGVIGIKKLEDAKNSKDTLYSVKDAEFIISDKSVKEIISGASKIKGVTGIVIPDSNEVLDLPFKPKTKKDVEALKKLIAAINAGEIEYTNEEATLNQIKKSKAFGLELYLDLVGENK